MNVKLKLISLVLSHFYKNYYFIVYDKFVKYKAPLKIKYILIFTFLLYSTIHAQWFEGNLYLPDSFSGTVNTQKIIWNATNDKVYLGGNNETFVTLDCETDEKIAPIRIKASELSLPNSYIWNRVNNSLYIWCGPYSAVYDSLFVVDCQTQQTIAILPFLRQSFGLPSQVSMCLSTYSNKLYLIRHNDSILYVISSSANQIIDTIEFYSSDVDTRHQLMIWNPLNNCLYAIGKIPRLHKDTTGLLTINCTNDSVVSFTGLTRYNEERYCFQIDTVRNKLYFSFPSGDQADIWKIGELDCNTNQITNIFPTNVGVGVGFLDFCLNIPERKIYYYSYQYNGYIHILDIPSGAEDSMFVGLARVGWSNHDYLFYWPVNNELYLFPCNDTMAVISLATGAVHYFDLPEHSGVRSRPFLHPVRGKLYISKDRGESVVVFDCETHTISKVIINGVHYPADILHNPIENKLYTTNISRPYLFVFDAEHNRALRQVQVAPDDYGLACFGFAWRHNKAYVSYPSYISVLNCHNDSVINVIGPLDEYYKCVYNPTLDKLYTYDISFFGNRLTYVIDCSTDVVIKVLETTGSLWQEQGDIKFDSLTNKIYMTGNNGFVIIDCTNDSVIKRMPSITGGSIFFRTHGDRRVYVKDAMFDRFDDSLLGYISFPIPRITFPYAYNGINDQLYICRNQVLGGSLEMTRIYVVDCSTLTIIDSILVDYCGQMLDMNMMWWNPVSNKLYFTPHSDSLLRKPLFIADCQTNQVINTFFQVGLCRSLRVLHCFDPLINRLYVVPDYGSKLVMIRDNISGTEEISNQKLGKRLVLKINPTLIKNIFWLEYSIVKKGTVKLDILDTLGRVKKIFKADWSEPGNYQLNINVSDLPAGVYFVRLKQGSEQIVKRLVIVR